MFMTRAEKALRTLETAEALEGQPLIMEFETEALAETFRMALYSQKSREQSKAKAEYNQLVSDAIASGSEEALAVVVPLPPVFAAVKIERTSATVLTIRLDCGDIGLKAATAAGSPLDPETLELPVSSAPEA